MSKDKKGLTKLTKNNGKFSVEEAISLCEKGVSLTDAAKVLGVSKQAISKKLQRYNYSHERLKAFKESRADLLANVQASIVHSLTEDQIKKMSPRDRIIAFGVLFDKERLLRGESTSNVSMFEYIVSKSHDKPERYT